MQRNVRQDWIREILETIEQLGRLADQLEAMQSPDLIGVIERITHLQFRLNMIRGFLERLNG